jgi:DNA-binding Lrp family transcriptional regulator
LNALKCGLAAYEGEIDSIDRKILNIYQFDTRRIAESIGEEVGLSAAAVQRRLKRLRAEGVIAAETAVLDKASVGPSMVTCNEHVTRFDTHVALERVKISLSLPIDEFGAPLGAIQNAR